MALTDYNDYKARVESQQNAYWFINAASAAAGVWMQTWRTPASSGVAPGTYEQCGSSLAGNLWQIDANNLNRDKKFFLAELSAELTATGAGFALLVDRLMHTSSLTLTVASSQNTNLPGAALPRSTDGVGVQAALVCWASGANTSAVTGTIQYTTPTGSTNTSPAFVISTGMVVDRIIPIPLAPGDNGLKSVEWFQVSASNTMAAGNYGIVLYRPLGIIPLTGQFQPEQMYPRYRNMLVGGGGALSSMMSSGCPDIFVYGIGGTAPTMLGFMNWIEAS